MPEEHPYQNRPENQEDPLAPGDALWDALGHAPKAKPDGWLATRTIARLRREAEQPALWLRPLALLRTAFAGSALAAAALVLGLLVMSPSAETDLASQEVAFEQTDYELLQTGQPVFDSAESVSGEEWTQGANMAAMEEGEPTLHQALELLADGSLDGAVFEETSWQ